MFSGSQTAFCDVLIDDNVLFKCDINITSTNTSRSLRSSCWRQHKSPRKAPCRAIKPPITGPVTNGQSLLHH